MKLHELIVFTHNQAHAAVLALTKKQPNQAYHELDKLYITLKKELGLGNRRYARSPKSL